MVQLETRLVREIPDDGGTPNRPAAERSIAGCVAVAGLLRLLPDAGTPGFPVALARSLREITNVDAVAINEFGMRPAWVATLVEISRDPVLVATDRLDIARLAAPVAGSREGIGEAWVREHETTLRGPDGLARPGRIRATSVRLSDSAAGCVVASFVTIAPNDVPPVAPAVIDVLPALWQVHARAVAVATERDALFEALGRRGLGAVTLDRRGAPISVNRRAADLMRASGALSLSPSRLMPATDAGALRLRESIAVSVGEMEQGRKAPTVALALTAADGDGGLDVRLCPVGTALPQDGVRAPAFVVFLQDPHRDLSPDIRANARRFALTPVETELACLLADGRQLDAAAKHLRISIHTARKYVQRIFSKTGTCRQADLVRLMISGASTRPDARETAPTGRETPRTRIGTAEAQRGAVG